MSYLIRFGTLALQEDKITFMQACSYKYQVVLSNGMIYKCTDDNDSVKVTYQAILSYMSNLDATARLRRFGTCCVDVDKINSLLLCDDNKIQMALEGYKGIFVHIKETDATTYEAFFVYFINIPSALALPKKAIN